MAAKLAPRVSANAIRTLKAYIKGKHSGAITDLLEPNHSGIFYPEILENRKFPDDFGEKLMHCDKNCTNCGYCETLYKKAVISLD